MGFPILLKECAGVIQTCGDYGNLKCLVIYINLPISNLTSILY